MLECGSPESRLSCTTSSLCQNATRLCSVDLKRAPHLSGSGLCNLICDFLSWESLQDLSNGAGNLIVVGDDLPLFESVFLDRRLENGRQLDGQLFLQRAQQLGVDEAVRVKVLVIDCN